MIIEKKNIIVKKEPSLSNGSTDKKTMKQTTINFKKKTSGKNPWESDSDDNSFSNSETQEDSPIVPKRTVTSRNKTTKNTRLKVLKTKMKILVQVKMKVISKVPKSIVLKCQKRSQFLKLK